MAVTTNSIDQMQIIPTGGALGAEVRGIDLTHPLPEDTIQRVHQALLAHCVLLFRGQEISDDDQVRFTNYFGQAVEHVRKQMPRPVKEIFFVSNVEKDGQTHRGTRQRRDPLPLRSVIPTAARNALYHLRCRAPFHRRCHAVVQLLRRL